MVGQGNAQHSGNDLKASPRRMVGVGFGLGWVGLSWLSWVGLSWLGCVLSGRIDWFIVWVGRVAGSIQHWPSLPSGSLVITWCQPLLLPFIFLNLLEFTSWCEIWSTILNVATKYIDLENLCKWTNWCYHSNFNAWWETWQVETENHISTKSTEKRNVATLSWIQTKYEQIHHHICFSNGRQPSPH